MPRKTADFIYRRKPYKDLRFTDDFMFRKVLRHDEDLCRRLAELLLDIKIDHISYKDDDHSVETTSDKKSVRMDVYLKDEKGTVFDLEMQNQPSDDIARRARFYQSMIDIEHLESGAGYNELPDSYIVFICTKDPYKKGLPKYDFRELCTEDPGIELGSGVAKVFINALSKSDEVTEDMRAFLDYLMGDDPRSELTRDIEGGIKRAKEFRPWEREYMTWEEGLIRAEEKKWYRKGKAEGLAEGEARGLAKGEASARMEDIDMLVSSGMATIEEACSILGVPYEEYKKYKSEG